MDNNYVIYHSHTMLSNPTTTMDSVNSYKDYINRAKELGMKGFGISEHGNTFEWLHKKEYCEENEIKYIHGIECYITSDFEEKYRDNYHTILIAKNYAGFLELNTLVSKSFNRAKVKIIDSVERFYYNPRISFDELINTSDNIIITTACIGGILGSKNILHNDFIKFLAKNKERCFLEIQHHNVEEQIEYNKYLLELHKKYNIKLIAGTDTHSLNNDYADGRIVLQKSKNIHFDEEEGWDLTLKSYDELINSYENQNSIPKEYYLEAINNTNELLDMVQEFNINREFKYPPFSDNPEEIVRSIVEEGILTRNIEDNNILRERLEKEYNAYRHNKAFNLLLLEHDVKKYARENKIYYGDSRGSVSGSIVAYLMYITNSNSIKHNLNFERFMNIERVSLADIDTDWSPSQRELIKEYLHNNDKYYTAEIVTFNTIADRGAIRDVGRALEIPLNIVDEIAKNYEENEIEYESRYPELFRYVNLLKGVITSVGSHPAATICSPITLYDNIGTITLSTNNHIISCLNMKEIDSLNFVKLDVLGLDAVERIAKTCELAGIEMLTSDNVDDKDKDVWDSIAQDSSFIFQFESDFASSYLKRVFRKDVIQKIKEKNPDLNFIDLMSVANGAIRPAGESYREALANGEFKDNGHEILNDFLKSTNGFCVYQEQILGFLNKFCGFSMGQADIIRRGFAKKTGTEQYIPKIKSGFIKTMNEKHNVSEYIAEILIEDFLRVIEDASDYLFSLNHSLPYSYIGYICGYLRYYYPLEFFTTLLNINKDNQEKTSKIHDYLTDRTKIKINPIMFRFSKQDYTLDKKTNSIYKGIKSIKYCNETMAEELYALRDNKYNNFIELLEDIKNKTSINARQLNILIGLDFFSEFGNAKMLHKIVEYYNLIANKTQMKAKNIKEDNILDGIVKRNSRLSNSGATYLDLNITNILGEIADWIELNYTKDYTYKEKILFQEEYLGYINLTTGKEEDRRKLLIQSVYPLISKKNNKCWAYSINTISIGSGKTGRLTVWAKTFDNNPFKVGDIVYVSKIEQNSAGYWYMLGYNILEGV